MALWIELRCDKQRRGCYSNVNNGPTALVSNNRAEIAKAIAEMEELATLSGWKQIKKGGLWNCPVCAKIQP